MYNVDVWCKVLIIFCVHCSDSKFVNCMMWDGKKSVSQTIFKMVSIVHKKSNKTGT